MEASGNRQRPFITSHIMHVPFFFSWLRDSCLKVPWWNLFYVCSRMGHVSQDGLGRHPFVPEKSY